MALPHTIILATLLGRATISNQRVRLMSKPVMCLLAIWQEVTG
jgi:hypothetical protein